MKSETITCYRGSDSERPGSWFTTDRRHAAYFGQVSEYVVTGRAIRVAASDVVGNLCGYAADEQLQDFLSESGANVAIVSGWEGSGLTILVDGADVEEV